MTRDEVRQALRETTILEFGLLVQQRDTDWVTDEAVAILDGVGHGAGLDPSWWRAPKRDGERRMNRQVREVLTDVDRMAQGME